MSAHWRRRDATSGDVDRIAAFSARVFRPAVSLWVRDLLSGVHPAVSVNDFSIVEDSTTAEILASICFIRQNWLLDGMRLAVGQIELVGTAESHRGQGLLRAQLEWFDQKLAAGQCVLACVQGVPTLYQHLGYHFAVPLKGGLRLWWDQVPEGCATSVSALRLAQPADWVRLAELFNQAQACLILRSERDAGLWAYQEQQSLGSEHTYETYVVEQAGRVTGYVRLARQPKRGALLVREVAVDSYADLLGIVVFLRELGAARQLTSAIFQIPSAYPTMSAIRSWGAEVISDFAWQVRVMAWPQLFVALAPVLEKRLADSLFQGYSGGLRLLLSERASSIRLEFQAGKLAAAEQMPEQGDWDVKLTEPLLTQLMLGYQPVQKLEECHLEMQVKQDARYLADVLFPKLDAYIYEVY